MPSAFSDDPNIEIASAEIASAEIAKSLGINHK
jgi:hypothetical protein